MRRAITCAALLALGTGCTDQAAATRAKARADFAKAIASVEDAQKRFVPQGKELVRADSTKIADLGNFRQESLDKASASLKAAADNPQVPDAQRVTARRILGNAHASAALYHTKLAVDESSSLSDRSTTLMSLLVAIDRADARTRKVDIDETPLIDKLNQTLADTKTRIEELDAQAGKHQKQIDAQTKQVDALRAKSVQALTRSQALRKEAFVKSGDEQYKVSIQAIEAERDSQKAAAEAQKIASRLDIARGELVIVERQVEVSRETVKQIETQVEAAKKRMDESKTALAAAIKDREEATAKLKKEANDLVAGFAKAEDKLIKANNSASEAVKALVVAAGQAKGADQRDVKMDLQSMRLTQIYVLTQHVTALSGFAKTFSSLAGQAKRLMPGVGEFATSSDGYKAAMDRLAEEAQGLLNEAAGTQTELQDGAKDDEAARAEGLRIQLLDYKARIDAARGLGPVPPTRNRGGDSPLAPAPAPAPGTGTGTDAAPTAAPDTTQPAGGAGAAPAAPTPAPSATPAAPAAAAPAAEPAPPSSDAAAPAATPAPAPAATP